GVRRGSSLQNAIAPRNSAFFVGASGNQSGSPSSSKSDAEYSACWLGAALSDAENAGLHMAMARFNAFTTTFMTGALPSDITLARASTGWYFDQVNQLRNPTAAGAVPGSPGTLPTNWRQGGGTGGLTQTVVGTGTENGIPYLDYRLQGTPNTSSSFSIECYQRSFITAGLNRH